MKSYMWEEVLWVKSNFLFSLFILVLCAIAIVLTAYLENGKFLFLNSSAAPKKWLRGKRIAITFAGLYLIGLAILIFFAELWSGLNGSLFYPSFLIPLVAFPSVCLLWLLFFACDLMPSKTKDKKLTLILPFVGIFLFSMAEAFLRKPLYYKFIEGAWTISSAKTGVLSREKIAELGAAYSSEAYKKSLQKKWVVDSSTWVWVVYPSLENSSWKISSFENTHLGHQIRCAGTFDLKGQPIGNFSCDSVSTK